MGVFLYLLSTVKSNIIQLGPFEVRERIGVGGMAEVWRGRHVRQNVPVAVKFITGWAGHREAYLRAFRNEVRAAAGLNHSNIITLFDHGRVSATAAEAWDGLAPGTPYLVMELASGGTLAGPSRPRSWASLQEVLLGLLDALAHAHARGVIHRDLKPANVVFCDAEDVRPGLKLTDFGIAAAVEGRSQAGTREAIAGTPQYMAPEQALGHWREYGPWTDLYALGCMTWDLVTGAPPFRGTDLTAMLFAHANEDPPQWVPQMAVPAGLEDWTRRLLRKAPGARFQRAADAAWALVRLRDAPPIAAESFDVHVTTGPDDTIDPTNTSSTPTLPSTRVAEAPAPDAWAGLPADGVLSTTLEGTGGGELPPQPSSWRRATVVTPTRLAGVGLALFGLRAVPLVDRFEARDAMWAALRQVRETGTPRVVVLRGPAGQGKSRLADWMARRAHEVGAATVIRAPHSTVGGASDGLSRGIARHLRCGGLERNDVRTRVEAQLRASGVDDPYEWHALAEIVHPTPADADAVVRFGRPRERHAVVHRFLARLGRNRPVILILDDVHWGGDSLAFLRTCLASRDELHVLAVLTVRDDALADRPDERGQIEHIVSDPAAEAVDVPPLSAGYSLDLVQGLLGLAQGLALEVVAQVEGNPLFAVQLLGDLVQRGVLEPGNTGFELAPGAALHLPDSLHDLWTERLSRVLGTADFRGLELAAILGAEVDDDELARACEVAGLAPADEAVEQLLQARLAVATERGFSFAHDMLRESLLRSARDACRWVPFHRACAQMLASGTAETAAERVRRARHLGEAGDREAALRPLLDSAGEYIAGAEFTLARQTLDERDSLMEELDLVDDDVRRAWGFVARANLHRYQWEFDATRRWARLVADADALAGEPVRAEALFCLAHAARQDGHMADAESIGRQARDIFSAHDDAAGVARTDLLLAITLRERGDLGGALVLYEQALGEFAAMGDEASVGACQMGIGNLHRQRKDLTEARAFYIRARAAFEHTANRNDLAKVINGLAELDRYEGDLTAAEAGYRQAAALFEAVASGQVMVVRLNLGLVLLRRGEHGPAREIFERVLARAQRPRFLAIAHVCLLPCLAHFGARTLWDQHCAEAERLLAETSLADPDLAELAEEAARTFTRKGDDARAARAHGIATAQWATLEMD